MANTSAIWQQMAHTTTIYHFLAAQQEPYKSLTLNKKCLRIFLKSQENAFLEKQNKCRGLGRKTSEDREKRNNMTNKKINFIFFIYTMQFLFCLKTMVK